MKKIIALLLAVTMLSAMFVGCSNSKDNTQTTPAAGNETETTAATGNDETTGATTAANDDIVELTWYMVGNGQPANYDAWKANLDKYLEEKIGVHLDVQVVSWGDWDSRREAIVSTNQKYDIMFTNAGTFSADVAMGAFMDITDYAKNAQALYNLMPESYWLASSIDGKIYGVPTYKDSSCTQYFVWDKALAEEHYPEYVNAHTMQDVTPGLKAIYDATGKASFILNNQGLEAILGTKFDGLGLGLSALGVSYDDAGAKVVCTFEQESVMNDLKTLREWFQAGYVNQDAATLAEAPKYHACGVAQGWDYAATTVWAPQMDVEADAVQWGDTVLSNDTVQGSMNCISAACEHPEKALALLELVNTDSYVRDALYYGLEGDNFDYVEEDGVKKVHRNNTDWSMAGYTQGTFFNVSMLEGETYNQWDEVKALNEAAKPSPALGFVADTKDIQTELGACIAIYKSYQPELMTGTIDPVEGVADMMEEMRAAGFDTIMTEVQRQLDAYLGK